MTKLTPRWGLGMSICNGRFLFLGASALLCLLVLSSQPASAQVAFGSIVGNVTDDSGGGMSGATIKITLILTNDSRSVVTNDAGAYTITTVNPGTYRVEVTRPGFRTFAASDILVNQNNVVRVDAQLQVGAVTERIEVTTTATAELQTERADVHAELTTKAMQELPQANRAYLGLLQLVPGVIPPAGQLSGGTNNPSKGMSFAFNSTNGTAQTVRIEGINGLNPWNRGYQSYVPSVEAIQNVNIPMRLTEERTCTTSTPPLRPTTSSRTRRGYRNLLTWWTITLAALRAATFSGTSCSTSAATKSISITRRIRGFFPSPITHNSPAI
jgi:hypothetical protein